MEEIFDNEFSGLFADFYDILQNNQSDVRSFTKIAKQYGPNILELGSGTGRILIPLAREGFTITGVELSQDMIHLNNKKLETEDQATINRCNIIHGDVTNFQLNQPFDLILAPCNLMNYFFKFEEVKGFFDSIKKHMKESSVLVIDNSLPDIKSWIKSNGKEEVLEFWNPKNETNIINRFTPSYDFINQLETDHIILEEYKEKKLIRRAECKETVTYYYPRELIQLLRFAGFDIFHQQGLLSKDVPIGHRGFEVVLFCRKNYEI